MTTATDTVPRIVLQDRWDAAILWERNGGDPTATYEAFVGALGTLIGLVNGLGADESVDGEIVLSDGVLFEIGDLIVRRVMDLGNAR